VASDKPYCPDCRKMDHAKVVKRTGLAAADEELF
jgi:ribosomal protein L36